MMGCPDSIWSGFAPGTTTFCEERLCSWIESPAIAFAAISYVLVALLIFRSSVRLTWLLRLFAWITLSMGVSSFLYHASHILIFQAFDLTSMFALSSLMLTINLKRIKHSLTHTALASIFTSLVLGAVLIFWLHPRHPGSSVFVGILAAALVLEAAARDFSKYLGLAALCLVTALTALKLERSNLCDPANHLFQWHAVWDSVSSLCYGLLFQHYRRFNDGLST